MSYVAINKCFCCGEDKNEILLDTRLNDDTFPEKGVIANMEPCEKCQDYMKLGKMVIALVALDDGYASEGMVVISESAFEKICNPDTKPTPHGWYAMDPDMFREIFDEAITGKETE